MVEPGMTKQEIHSLATDGWWIPPSVQKSLIKFGHGLEIGVMLPNQAWLVGVFEFGIEVKKQVCITLRCNIEDLKTTWHGQEIPDEAKLFGFKLTDNDMFNVIGVDKVMSHGAVLVVEYDLGCRFNADQSNLTWSTHPEFYLPQDTPAEQMQDMRTRCDLFTNTSQSTRLPMSKLSPSRCSSPVDVDEATPLRKRKRGKKEVRKRGTSEINDVRQNETDDSSTKKLQEGDETVLDQSCARNSSARVVRSLVQSVTSWGATSPVRNDGPPLDWYLQGSLSSKDD